MKKAKKARNPFTGKMRKGVYPPVVTWRAEINIGVGDPNWVTFCSGCRTRDHAELLVGFWKQKYAVLGVPDPFRYLEETTDALSRRDAK